MNIILIGPGSIGLRHLRNLLEAGYRQVTVISRSGQLPAKFSYLKVYSSLESALAASSYDAAFICTPTSYHLPALRALLAARIPDIYIEKPVSNSLDGLADVLSEASSYVNNIVTGFDLHFDPGMQKVKELIEDGTIGDIVSINAQVGQYLPDWRPHEDYRKGMSARKETGGGVMLDLVHEFDYLLWLAGPVETVACQYTHTKALAIETEDVCDVLLRFQNGATGTIHLDYLQHKLVRNCMVTGKKGTIQWNLAECKVSWIDEAKRQFDFTYKGYERNDRFKEIIRSFLENKKDERLTSLNEGIESLKLVLAAKHSSENGVFVHVPSFNSTN